VAHLTTKAILLRSYAYSETSQILRFYSEDHGVLGAMARGTRKTGGKRGGPLATFSEGPLSLHFKESRDLQTFREFSPSKTRRGLATDPVRLSGASVLGELILQHAESEGNPVLYERLGEGLDAMDSQASSDLIPHLLAHLWGLIRELGFEPTVRACVDCGRRLDNQGMGRFDFGAGGIRCLECPGESGGPRLGPQARDQLSFLVQGTPPDDLRGPRAHLRLVSDFVTYHLSGGTPLRSMSVLAKLTSDSDA
jgi:DNA repair protein RecO (recombination protein O)